MLKQSGDFLREAQRLRVLNDYLRLAMMEHLQKYQLAEQIDDFMTSTFIIRSGGAIAFRNPVLNTFPLSESILGKKIVLYGAGTFGQQLMKRLLDKKVCEVVGWGDDDYREYRRCCMDVDPVERVVLQDYDYVVIANLSCIYAEAVQKELMDYGISTEKILTLQTTSESRALALQEFLALSE